MPRYGYFPGEEFPQVTVSTTFDRKQFGGLELIGNLMQYKVTQKDYWSRIGLGGSLTTSAVPWKNALFFGGCDRNFYCINLNGKELWRFRTEGIILEDCVINEGIVFFESADRNVYAVDCQTGRLVWKFETNGPSLGRVTVHEGVVYANSFDKNIYALDEKKGNELWRIPTVGPQAGASIKDNVLYSGYVGSVFYAYDIKTRRQLWTFKTQKDVCGWRPAFWKDYVYIGSFEGNLYALNRVTGELAWKFSASDTAYSAIVSGNRIFFGSNDHNVYCLDAESGKLLWKFSTGELVGNIAESGGMIYFGSYDNNVYCLDAQTGMQIWRFRTNGFVHRVSVIGNNLYAGSWDCHMYCLDAQTGRLIWKFKTSLGTPSQIEPPETGMVRSAEVVWQAPEEEKAKEKRGEAQMGDYGKLETGYVGAGMGDYLGKKKRGYV